MPEEVRIDKWLWAARFYKTRSLAKHAVEHGKVKINGQRCKPARAVQLNDEVSIHRDGLIWVLNVTQLSDRRGPARVAQTLYRESEESEAKRAEQQRFNALARQAVPTPERRPNKKQRRQLRDIKQHDPG